MANMLFWGEIKRDIFRAFPLPAPPYPSLPLHTFSLLSHSFPTSPVSHFIPLLPFPKDVSKKLSYRGHNVLSIIKTHERNTVSEHLLLLFVHHSRLPGGIMFSTCPFVHSSVSLFVRLLPNCERYT